MKKLYLKIKTWWLSTRLYVILDPADNSITLSKALFKHMVNKAQKNDDARVFVFSTNTGHFGFMAKPEIDQSTQMCEIQYNDKYRCIGFETLCPSVGRIFYEYGIDANKRIKLSVSIQHTNNNKLYYQIDRPNSK